MRAHPNQADLRTSVGRTTARSRAHRARPLAGLTLPGPRPQEHRRSRGSRGSGRGRAPCARRGPRSRRRRRCATRMRAISWYLVEPSPRITHSSSAVQPRLLTWLTSIGGPLQHRAHVVDVAALAGRDHRHSPEPVDDRHVRVGGQQHVEHRHTAGHARLQERRVVPVVERVRVGAGRDQEPGDLDMVAGDRDEQRSSARRLARAASSRACAASSARSSRRLAPADPPRTSAIGRTRSSRRRGTRPAPDLRRRTRSPSRRRSDASVAAVRAIRDRPATVADVPHRAPPAAHRGCRIAAHRRGPDPRPPPRGDAVSGSRGRAARCGSAP